MIPCRNQIRNEPTTARTRASLGAIATGVGSTATGCLCARIADSFNAQAATAMPTASTNAPIGALLRSSLPLRIASDLPNTPRRRPCLPPLSGDPGWLQGGAGRDREAEQGESQELQEAATGGEERDSGMIDPAKLAAVNRYANLIRNAAKRRYAFDYIAWLRNGAVGLEPQKPQGLSFMGAQAVRHQVAEFNLWT